jgi:hypothetical protein
MRRAMPEVAQLHKALQQCSREHRCATCQSCWSSDAQASGGKVIPMRVLPSEGGNKAQAAAALHKCSLMLFTDCMATRCHQ